MATHSSVLAWRIPCQGSLAGYIAPGVAKSPTRLSGRHFTLRSVWREVCLGSRWMCLEELDPTRLLFNSLTLSMLTAQVRQADLSLSNAGEGASEGELERGEGSKHYL